MPHPPERRPFRAALFLLLATVGWGLSFPAMKALEMSQKNLLPESSSWFFTGMSVVIRFGVSALVILLFSIRTIRSIRRAEISQGVALALFGSFGLLLQMDGLVYTEASTSAFLTQCYCLFIPIIVAVQRRRLPSPLIFLCTLMVTVGVAILARFNWRQMHIGRGELETLIASMFFTGQILCLEHPAYRGNRVNHTTAVMFVLSALLVLPLVLAMARSASDIYHAYNAPGPLLFVGILTLICTLGSYVLMNYWQPHLEASQAGLIYCVEPVCASFFALFLPGLFSNFAGIHYPNENVTPQLLTGGGLITGANILILWQAASAARSTPPARGTAGDAIG